MPTTTSHEINRHFVEWQTTINAVPHSFAIEVHDSIPSDLPSSDLPILNLNGIGEGSYSAAMAPKFGQNVISPILPLRGELELTPVNIERIAVEVPQLIAVNGLAKINQLRRSLLSREDAASFKPQTAIAMMARSQGGATGIRAAAENSKLFNQLALVMPFGLNREALGDTTEQRRYATITRLGLAALRADALDYGNFRSSQEVSTYMMKSLFKGTLFSSLDAALTFDLSPELKRYAEDHRTAVFAGSKDPLFPTAELAATMGNSNAVLIELAGTHATPGSRQGQRQMQTAYDWSVRQAA